MEQASSYGWAFYSARNHRVDLNQPVDDHRRTLCQKLLPQRVAVCMDSATQPIRATERTRICQPCFEVVAQEQCKAAVHPTLDAPADPQAPEDRTSEWVAKLTKRWEQRNGHEKHRQIVVAAEELDSAGRTEERSTSVPTVSGGLPTLGDRH
jgi:hypothetical protein